MRETAEETRPLNPVPSPGQQHPPVLRPSHHRSQGLASLIDNGFWIRRLSITNQDPTVSKLQTRVEDGRNRCASVCHWYISLEPFVVSDLRESYTVILF
ncbi:hypothetical protein OPV22_033338 [Ensete ventricosum]|uniref:Uncharacterized protein n=1 Tax=Ensete ventricosum TaxID=4639 RepID=A0AAV8PPP5_ENSVE|nr:hypothetical protein OPV22_033338 [Ensete ventricosum]